MARGERSESNPNRKVDMMSHINRVKDNIINKGYNTDLDDPNTPEYTGQDARISDLSPRNIYKAMTGGGGNQPPQKPKTKTSGGGDDKPKKNSNDEAPPHGIPRPKYPERESREDKYKNGWYN
jgi:hypothetical protein